MHAYYTCTVTAVVFVANSALIQACSSHAMPSYKEDAPKGGPQEALYCGGAYAPSQATDYSGVAGSRRVDVQVASSLTAAADC